MPDALVGWRSAVRFSGPNLSDVPDWITQFTAVQALHLSKNQFTTVPDCIGEHLKVMERNGLIRRWHDRALKAGEKW